MLRWKYAKYNLVPSKSNQTTSWPVKYDSVQAPPGLSPAPSSQALNPITSPRSTDLTDILTPLLTGTTPNLKITP